MDAAITRPLRIGFDATALPSSPVGAGRYIIRLIRALSGQNTGHELVVFVQASRRPLIDTPEIENVRWVETPEIGPARRLLWEQTVLPGLVRQARLDLLHSPHYTRPLELACASVVTFHDMTFFLYPELHTPAKRLFFPWMMRLSARRADAIIADSESTRRDAMRILQIPAEKIITVTLGIGEEFRRITDARPARRLPQALRPPTGLFTLCGHGGAAQEPAAVARGICPVSAGRRPTTTRRSRPAGLDGRRSLQSDRSSAIAGACKIYGLHPQSMTCRLVYNLAQILLYPSRYEGFGFPPLEAMACGTPVITTAVSAMQDQVGEAGLLVPPQDEQALFEAMQRLLHDRLLRDDLSIRGQRQASLFTWEQTALQTLQVYRQAITSRQSQ